jgi:hypothetical protein
MREAPLNACASAHSAKAELVTLKGKRKRNLGKKLRKRMKMARGVAIKEPKREGKMDTVRGGKGQAVINTSRNPESKGGGLVGEKRGRRDQPTTSPPTSGGECSG